MQTYEFEDVETGAIVEAMFTMADVPEVGSEVEIDGRMCRRIFSTEQQRRAVPDVRFKSMQMPLNYRFAKHFDEDGVPVFSSKRELDECLARANDAGEKWGWNQ